MKMQIKEFADFTGVSVRTLHYYDENSFLRMQEILFYRELDFSLKSIGEILFSEVMGQHFCALGESFSNA